MDITYGWLKLYIIFVVSSVPFSPSLLTISTMTSFNSAYASSDNHFYIELNNISFLRRLNKLMGSKNIKRSTEYHPVVLPRQASPTTVKIGKRNQYTLQVLPSPPTERKNKTNSRNCIDRKLCGAEAMSKEFYKKLQKSKTSFPVSTNSSEHKHIIIKVQILPWTEFYSSSLRHSCINTNVALKIVNYALRRNPPPAGITLVPILPQGNATCSERHSVVHLFSQLTSSSSNIVIGGIDPSLCRIARRIAEKHRKLLILWTCSQAVATNELEKGTSNGTQNNAKEPFKSSVMVTPVARQIFESVGAVVRRLGWRQVAIVSIDSVYWKVLAHSIDAELRKDFVLSFHTIKSRSTAEDLVHLMKSVPSSAEALLVVSSLVSPTLSKLLRTVEEEGIIKFSSVIIIDPFYELENLADSSTKQFSNESSESNSSSLYHTAYKIPGVMTTLSVELKRAIMLLASSSGSSSINPDSTEKLKIFGLSQKNQFVEDRVNITEKIHVEALLQQEAHEVLTRLIYDSVSLASHILRKNVGAHHLQRKRRRKYATSKIYARKSPYKIAKFSARKQSLLPLEQIHASAINNTNIGQTHTQIGHEEVKNASVDGLKVPKGSLGNHRIAERHLKHIILEQFRNIPAVKFEPTTNKLESHPIPPLLRLDPKKWTEFEARNGKSFVDNSGRRYFEFFLLDYDSSTDLMIPVLRIKPSVPRKGEQNDDGIDVVSLDEIDWAVSQTTFMELPYLNHSIGYAILFVVIIISIVVGSFAMAVALRKWLRQKEMSKGPYKILLNAGDIALSSQIETALKTGNADVKGRPDLLEGGHLAVPFQSNIGEKNLTEIHSCSLREADKIKAKYNGDFIHMRYFQCQGNFEVKNKTMTQLKLMYDLRHENLNGFVGLLCDQVRPGFVFEYGSRGSLEDIIKQKDIKLDWSFRLSLLTDLVRGMRYLHCSPLRMHGRLTSRNCIIDGRWVLKITDYGLSSVYDVQNINQPYRTTKELLYKAPELLRDESLVVKGTQPGDVFAFAIIMQEVVVRGEPYCMVTLSYSEILVRLKNPPPMIRPSVSKGAAPPDVINIMKQCWAQLPEMRPDFNQINDLFKKLNEGRRLNIVDTMFQMLEKYSSNLEDLIKERTEQLDMEKKKTEHLLNRMLPSSVANQLKLGTAVAPEEFDEVTIYFSDIVGFTTISAYSTPFEVVDLLNELYTAFDATIDHYNVYKVETIGDAYMVVGGVPKKMKDHAAQVATMALDLLHLSGKFRISHLPNIPLMLRIGMHTGPCCAGVVGMKMPRYCLFGDTVNTASRMESSGSAWRIHVSETTVHKLREAGGYNIEYRGRTLIKGKGLMPTFWILGKDDFQKELPVPPDIGQAHNLDEELLRLGRQHYKTRRDSMNEASLASIKTFNMNLKQQQEHSMKAVSSSLHQFSLSTNLKVGRGTKLPSGSQILEPTISGDETEEDNSSSLTKEIANCKKDKETDKISDANTDPLKISAIQEETSKESELRTKADDSTKVKNLLIKDESSNTKLEVEKTTGYRNPASTSKRKRSNELDTKNIISNLNDISRTIDEMGKKVAMQSTAKKIILKQTLQKPLDNSSDMVHCHESQSIALKNSTISKGKESNGNRKKTKVPQETPRDQTKSRKLTLGNGMVKKCFSKVPIFRPDELILSNRACESSLKNLSTMGPNIYAKHIKENSNFDQIYYKNLEKFDVCSVQPCNINESKAAHRGTSYTFSDQIPPDNKSPSPAESTLI